MKLEKFETIEVITKGGILVKKFDRLYGTYYYIIYENKNIYNIKKNICDGLIKSLKLEKINISPNETNFIINN